MKLINFKKVVFNQSKQIIGKISAINFPTSKNKTYKSHLPTEILLWHRKIPQKNKKICNLIFRDSRGTYNMFSHAKNTFGEQ